MDQSNIHPISYYRVIFYDEYIETTVGMADSKLSMQLYNLESVLYLYKRLYYPIKVKSSFQSG